MASFLQGVAYPGVRDNRSTINTKIGYEKMPYPAMARKVEK